ncbi:MAG: pyridoxamine 5'-phosphate oxidase family protein [Thermoplasmata archaeon]|nr:pyridoxamine 5'-phosphate oxidase family protein [Thermoplasmata archaeon]
MEEWNDTVAKEIWSSIEPMMMAYLATKDGQFPRVRPVTPIHAEEKLWILTGTESAKISQIRADPNVEVCYPLGEGESQGYVRIAGNAEIVEGRDTKNRIAGLTPFFDMHWKSTEDPNYTLLNIHAKEIEFIKPGEMLAKKYRL